MSRWKRSLYTTIVRSSEGAILHNSFMGAIALIPSHKGIDIDTLFHTGIGEEDLTDADLSELCEQRFFVPDDLDETAAVAECLRKERELAHFNLIILAHENCNFRCEYCYEGFSRGRIGRSVVSGLKSLVARKASEVPGLTISWFGGEPLLARDAIYELSDSFIKDCDKNGIPFAGNITTNGYFLYPNVVDSLIKHRVTQFQVTLDGPESTHDQTRTKAGGGKTYRHIINNLTRMKDSPHQFRMTIRVNFNAASIPLMDEFFAETSALFANDPRFCMYFRPIGKWGGPRDSEMQTCDFEQATAVKAELTRRHVEYGFSKHQIKGTLSSHGTVCYAAKESSIIVGSDGSLYKCTLAFSDPRNHVGHLTQDGNLIIDKEKWKLWVDVDDLDTSGCTSCKFLPSCQSRACPLHAMNGKRAVCPMTKVEYESMVKSVATGGAA